MATVPADRSMPPVSMVSVWQAASMARGMAILIVLLNQNVLMIAGLRIASTPISANSRMTSGIKGLSTIRRPMRPIVVGWSAVMLMCGAPVSPIRRRT